MQGRGSYIPARKLLEQLQAGLPLLRGARLKLDTELLSSIQRLSQVVRVRVRVTVRVRVRVRVSVRVRVRVYRGSRRCGCVRVLTAWYGRAVVARAGSGVSRWWSTLG